MAATDGKPVPQRGVAYRVTFPILDADGDLVTGATGLDSEISKDSGTFADVDAEATEVNTNSGMYFLDLTATEMTADIVALIIKTSTGGAKTTPIVMYPEESGDIRVNVTLMAADVLTASALATDAVDELVDQTWNEDATGHQTLGTFGQAIGDPVANSKTLYAALVTDAVGASVTADVATVQGDTDDIQTRLPASLVGGAMDSDVSVIQANAITASAMAVGAIAADAFAAGAIDAAAIATGAIDADAIAADAVTELRSIVSGTTTSGGTTTTCIDTARTDIIDTWNGQWILFTSGTETNKMRLITDFNASTDTITFAPAVSASLATSVTYEILPASSVDVQSWLAVLTAHVAPNALVAGAVDADVSAIQAGAIDAAAIATGAIDADALATDAVDEIVDQVWEETASDHVGAGSTGNLIERLDIIATGGAGGLTDARAVLLSNLDAAISTVATPAQVNTEVLDVLNVDMITLPANVAPPLAPTHREAITHLYKAYRNRKEQSATEWRLFADNESTVEQKAVVSDDGTDARKEEIVAGS